MKNIIFYFMVALTGFTAQSIQAQEESVEERIERLEELKEEVIEKEKAALKREIENIELQLKNKVIKEKDAVEMKEEAAKKHALNIENQVAIINNKIELLKRGEDVPEDESVINIRIHRGAKKEKPERERDRTTVDLVFAAGFNNALTEDQKIEESDFKIGGSRFFEIGWAWRTRVFEESNWLRLKYGVSFQFNGLKPTDNRYFVQNEELTVLEEYPLDLEKSKFRMDNLVFPVLFEFGTSDKHVTDSGYWFSTEDHFKMGLGGYAGFNIGERQKLKFEEDGDNVKQKLKGDYNTNEFIYGLSGYIGWGSTSLYVKYDLNPIFKDPNPELHNVSVGLRFDLY